MVDGCRWVLTINSITGKGLPSFPALTRKAQNGRCVPISLALCSRFCRAFVHSSVLAIHLAQVFSIEHWRYCYDYKLEYFSFRFTDKRTQN